MCVSASCRKLWQQANHQHLWEIPNFTSSQMHKTSFIFPVPQIQISSLHLNSPTPNTHSSMHANFTFFLLSSPFCSLSLCMSWHSRELSQEPQHAPNEYTPTALKPERKWEDEEIQLIKQRNTEIP